MLKEQLLKKYTYTLFSSKILMLGIFFIFLSFAFSLIAYYMHIHLLHQFSLSSLLLSQIFLLTILYKDIKAYTKSTVIALFVLLSLTILYFSLRVIFHRFDLSVGDPSDYFLAGICSVIYKQDIGFFLPLTASISAVGYTIFGLKFAPFINILITFLPNTLIYIILRKMQIHRIITLFIIILNIILPLNIWFASTSFSDPLWQLFLLSFIVLSSIIMSTRRPSSLLFITLAMLLSLIPFLRGESVLYFGLIIILSLYHFWKYTSLKHASFIMCGLVLLTISIYLTLDIREQYLLKMQFSRVIPNINKALLMNILYGVIFLGIIQLSAFRLFKSSLKKLSFPFLLSVLFIVFKILFAYYYSQKELLTFIDILFLNEYSFMLGNFGIPLTFLMLLGIIFLYIRSLKGHVESVMLILVYTIFYIPFIMQKVTFQDPHAFLYYWNRYYLSAIMMIHLISLGYILQLCYLFFKNNLTSSKYSSAIFTLFFVILLGSSLPLNMYKIVLNESHQRNAYKLAPWVKKNTGRHIISVIYDSSIIYKQNKGHIGTNNIKYLISRLFSIYQINAKDYQEINTSQLGTDFSFTTDLSQRHYVLCVAQKPCILPQSYLRYINSLILPLSWREHYSLHSPIETQNTELSHSHINQWELHFDLYEVSSKLKQKFEFNKKIYFGKDSSLAKNILNNGWLYNNINPGAWSLGLHPRLILPFIKSIEHSRYSLVLDYYLFNATKDTPRTITFSINGQKLKQIKAYISRKSSITLKIPKQLLSSLPLELNIDIDDYAYKKKKVPYGVFIESIKIIKFNSPVH